MQAKMGGQSFQILSLTYIQTLMFLELVTRDWHKYFKKSKKACIYVF